MLPTTAVNELCLSDIFVILNGLVLFHTQPIRDSEHWRADLLQSIVESNVCKL